MDTLVEFMGRIFITKAYEKESDTMSKQDIHTPEEWARILKEQADLTEEFRHTLYEKVEIKTRKKILDIGCGTGAVTADIASLTEGHITGIDVDGEKLEYAKPIMSNHINLMIADVLQLPFKDETFDLVVFNIVLTHIHEQQKAVCEMARVTQKNGIVLATMEPDYAGKLDYPESNADPLFQKALDETGIEQTTGRKLKYFFGRAGLTTEIGIYAEYLDLVNEDAEKQMELFLKNFGKTEELLKKNGWTDQEIVEYKKEQTALIEDGLAFSFVPCFYAIGRKL